MNDTLLAYLAVLLAVLAPVFLAPAYRSLQQLRNYSPVGITPNTAISQVTALRHRVINFGSAAAIAGGASGLALYNQLNGQTIPSWLIILVWISAIGSTFAGVFAVDRASKTQSLKAVEESYRIKEPSGHRD
ncbi:hypothetical protein ACFYVR_25170 [Rhodococcus sp. NPDC003318]|uniref:hypothetical protein n=1 Tax=Rhodococcus sp. NPDC003318 TaxID=3364503 RepID=UPI003683D0C1